MDQLKGRLEEHKSDFALLVRDNRNRIPPKKGGMPKTVDKLKEFQSVGGQVVYFDYINLAALYALVYTSDKIGSGDLSYVAGPHGERKEIQQQTLLTFVGEEFRCDLITSLEDLFLGVHTRKKATSSGLGPRKEKEILAAIEAVLRKPPFKFTLDMILVNIRLEGIAETLSPELLAELMGRHGDKFDRISVMPPIYFMQ